MKTELDVRRARRDLAAFSAMVAPSQPLTSWQTQALALEARVTVLLAGRQMGKSYSQAMLAVWWAFRSPGQRVLVISAGEEASRRLLGTIRGLVSGPLLVGAVVDESASLVRLSNGSEIRSVPASAKQVRGWSVDLLLVDEAAEVDDDLLQGAAFPTTTARPDARIVLASTPHADGGTFYRNALAGMDASSRLVRTFAWKAKAAGGDIDAPWITREVIEHMRATLTSDRFRREYLCEWSASSDVLFPRPLLTACTADLELPDLEGFSGPAEILGGVDWGVSHDRSVVSAFARLPVGAFNTGRRVPVFVGWPLRVFDAGVPGHEVLQQIAGADVRWWTLSSEKNGPGGYATQDLQALFAQQFPAGAGPPVRGRTTTADTKAHTYFRLQTLAERGQLVFPRHERLLRELAGLRVERRPSGSVGIEAAGSGFDDLPDSLMVAAGPWRGGCLLADLVEDAPPEARVDADAETVETGGGLVVPRRPVLQSVAGMEVTAPRARGRAPRPPGPGDPAWLVEARPNVQELIKSTRQRRAR